MIRCRVACLCRSGSVRTYPGSDESVASAVKQVIHRFGHIDVLVNNAGVGSTGTAEEFSITQGPS